MVGHFSCLAVDEIHSGGVCRHPGISLRGGADIRHPVAGEGILPIPMVEVGDGVCVAVEQVQAMALGAYPYGICQMVTDNPVKFIGCDAPVASLERLECLSVETVES